MMRLHVVFIHGFLGGVDSFGSWPELLSKDEFFSGSELNTSFLDYHTEIVTPSAFRKWTGGKPRVPSIKTIANRLLGEVDYLRSTDDKLRIVVIGHSMGGLIARYALLTRARLNQPSPADLLITLATPHNGGELGRFVKYFPIASSQARELAKDGPIISDLQREWAAVYQLNEQQRIYAFVGDQDGVISTSASGDDYHVDVCPRDNWDTLNADHISISKPTGIRDPLYTRPRDRIVKWLSELKDPAPASDYGFRSMQGEPAVDAGMKGKRANESVSQVLDTSSGSDASNAFVAYHRAMQQCSDVGVAPACLATEEGWMEAELAQQLINNDESLNRQLLPQLRTLINDAVEHQLDALESLSHAVVLLLFDVKKPPSVPSDSVLYLGDSSTTGSAYYLVDARVNKSGKPAVLKRGENFALDAPEAFELPKSPGLDDRRGAPVDLVAEKIIERFPGIRTTGTRATQLHQINDFLGRMNFTGEHFLLCGFKSDRETLKQIKSTELNNLRVIELCDDIEATEFERCIKSVMVATVGQIEGRRGTFEGSVPTEIKPDRNYEQPALKASAFQVQQGAITVKGDNNEITVNSAVRHDNSALIMLLESLRVELRNHDEETMDILARETKTMIDQPENLEENAGDLLQRISVHAGHGSKLLNLVTDSQKALQAMGIGV